MYFLLVIVYLFVGHSHCEDKLENVIAKNEIDADPLKGFALIYKSQLENIITGNVEIKLPNSRGMFDDTTMGGELSVRDGLARFMLKLELLDVDKKEMYSLPEGSTRGVAVDFRYGLPKINSNYKFFMSVKEGVTFRGTVEVEMTNSTATATMSAELTPQGCVFGDLKLTVDLNPEGHQATVNLERVGKMKVKESKTFEVVVNTIYLKHFYNPHTLLINDKLSEIRVAARSQAEEDFYTEMEKVLCSF